ncbi:hypothetical protein ACQ4XT_11430 [Halobacillus faecis]
MKKELREKFPKWCSLDEQYSTVLTDDLDSLLGCAIQKQVKGHEIDHFYNFNTLYKGSEATDNKLIGIDLALHNGMSWCNHVVKIGKDDYVNPRTANLNVINNIHKGNYFEKYAGSTAMLMWSFYDLPLPETKLGKMLLLCIDSGFLGHYDNRFKEAHNNYLRMLGFDELIDLLNDTNKQDYFDLQKQYKTKAKIRLNSEGNLQTNLPLSELEGVFNLPLELPTQQFSIRKRFKETSGTTQRINSKEQIDKKIISFALTGKNKFKYTYL